MSTELMQTAVGACKCFMPRVAKAIVAGVSASLSRHQGSMRKVSPVFMHYRSVKLSESLSDSERVDFVHSLSEVFAILQEHAKQWVFAFSAALALIPIETSNLALATSPSQPKPGTTLPFFSSFWMTRVQ